MILGVLNFVLDKCKENQKKRRMPKKSPKIEAISKEKTPMVIMYRS